MKIDGIAITSLLNAQEIKKIKQVEVNKPTGAEDKVVVSDKAQIFQSLLNKAKDIPTVREERVQQVQEQMANGEFEINAAKIARNMLFGSEE